jgi:tRNA pseudouridine55 synthase
MYPSLSPMNSLMKSEKRDISGVFVLDKPIGLSSHQALKKIKWLFKAKKAGHTGSLDVLASGLLPICFGDTTKFSRFVLDADKTYLTTAKLGERTKTCDRESEVVESRPVPAFSLDRLEETLARFRGDIEQVPSMYSALKHQGQPLYKLARQGIEVERPARPLTIHALKLLAVRPDEIDLFVKCSKGTYIRNLVDDIGQDLGCGAHVNSLRRIEAGPFKESTMKTMEATERLVEEAGFDALPHCLLPTDSLLIHLPSLTLNELEGERITQGQKLLRRDHKPGGLADLFKLYVAGNFIGLGELSDAGVLSARRMCVFSGNTKKTL